jgi:hypothetical protein
MYLPAPRTQYASEFGHLIRVVSIYSKVESILDVINGSFPRWFFRRTLITSWFLIGSESGVLSNNALVEPEQSLQVSPESLDNDPYVKKIPP